MWIILTGEYPPQPGGVSDYTRLVAEALVDTGVEVHVWAPPFSSAVVSASTKVHVHRLSDHFGRRGLPELITALDRLPTGFRVLVQYVPHAFGWKAMNLPFCIWLWTQRHKLEIFVMFHEVAFPWVSHGRIWRHNTLALVNRLMAFFVTRSARRLFVSIPGWHKLLKLSAGNKLIEWLPVPTNLPTKVDARAVAIVRKRLLRPPSEFLIGHFGTFGGEVARALRQVVPRILAEQASARVLLIGRRSSTFANLLRGEQPRFASRLLATGDLGPKAAAEHLAACDLLIQPYPDGISSRRGSVMAGLVLGLPIVTTRGHLMEPIWQESGAVCLVDTLDMMVTQTCLLLNDHGGRFLLGRAGAALYEAHFDLRHTVSALQQATAEG